MLKFKAFSTASIFLSSFLPTHLDLTCIEHSKTGSNSCSIFVYKHQNRKINLKKKKRKNSTIALKTNQPTKKPNPQVPSDRLHRWIDLKRMERGRISQECLLLRFQLFQLEYEMFFKLGQLDWGEEEKKSILPKNILKIKKAQSLKMIKLGPCP